MYIDESGDLGLNGSNYLIIVALLIKDFRPLDRIIKNMRRNKFKKELSKVNEIKGNKSSFEVRIHMLKELNKIDNSKILAAVLNKTNLHSEFLINDKNMLYNYVAGYLTHQIKINGHLEVRIDKSKGKQMLRDDFDHYFRAKISNNSIIKNIKIYHSYSHAWSGLQFADMIAWSFFQKYEHKNSLYTNIIDINCFISKIWNK